MLGQLGVNLLALFLPEIVPKVHIVGAESKGGAVRIFPTEKGGND